MWEVLYWFWLKFTWTSLLNVVKSSLLNFMFTSLLNLSLTFLLNFSIFSMLIILSSLMAALWVLRSFAFWTIYINKIFLHSNQSRNTNILYHTNLCVLNFYQVINFINIIHHNLGNICNINIFFNIITLKNITIPTIKLNNITTKIKTRRKINIIRL